jgi:hypothetical protein
VVGQQRPRRWGGCVRSNGTTFAASHGWEAWRRAEKDEEMAEGGGAACLRGGGVASPWLVSRALSEATAGSSGPEVDPLVSIAGSRLAVLGLLDRHE